MPYRLGAEETIDDSARRVVREQIDKAIGEIDRPDLDEHGTVHQVRKRCKKIRGALRLVRDALPDDYARENRWYRDAARSLSGIRDAQSVIESFDNLLRHFGDAIDARAFGDIRLALIERRERCAEEETDLAARLDTFRRTMEEGRGRLNAWQYRGDDEAAIRQGLRRTYQRACRGLGNVMRDPDTATIHEWRKRVKYHWHQLKLLRPVWHGPLKARHREAGRLADVLGHDHDLAVLRDAVLAQEQLDPGRIQALLALMSQRQGELRAEAKSIGGRLFAEKPKAFARRMLRYHRIWRAGK